MPTNVLVHVSVHVSVHVHGPAHVHVRVFSEVPFWNSAEYGILYGIGFISRNSAKFFTVQFCGIPFRFVYTEFCIPSNLATAFCIMQSEVKSQNFGRLPGPLKGQSGKKITYGGPTYYLHWSF